MDFLIYPELYSLCQCPQLIQKNSLQKTKVMVLDHNVIFMRFHLYSDHKHKFPNHVIQSSTNRNITENYEIRIYFLVSGDEVCLSFFGYDGINKYHT